MCDSGSLCDSWPLSTLGWVFCFHLSHFIPRDEIHTEPSPGPAPAAHAGSPDSPGTLLAAPATRPIHPGRGLSSGRHHGRAAAPWAAAPAPGSTAALQVQPLLPVPLQGGLFQLLDRGLGHPAVPLRCLPGPLRREHEVSVGWAWGELAGAWLGWRKSCGLWPQALSCPGWTHSWVTAGGRALGPWQVLWSHPRTVMSILWCEMCWLCPGSIRPCWSWDL